MKIYWNHDEWYPVLLPRSEPGGWDKSIEVPQEFVDRYNAALKEWAAVQLEILKRFHPEDKDHWWAEDVSDELLPTKAE